MIVYLFGVVKFRTLILTHWIPCNLAIKHWKPIAFYLPSIILLFGDKLTNKYITILNFKK